MSEIIAIDPVAIDHKASPGHLVFGPKEGPRFAVELQKLVALGNYARRVIMRAMLPKAQPGRPYGAHPFVVQSVAAHAVPSETGGQVVFELDPENDDLCLPLQFAPEKAIAIGRMLIEAGECAAAMKPMARN